MSSTETAHEGRSARANAERRLGWMLCAPAVTVMLVVTAYPIAYAVWLSLQRYDLRFPDDREFIGLANYASVLSASQWWDSVLSTVIITVFSVIIELVLGFTLAWVMHRAIFGRGLVRASTLIPYGIITVNVCGFQLHAFDHIPPGAACAASCTACGPRRRPSGRSRISDAKRRARSGCRASPTRGRADARWSRTRAACRRTARRPAFRRRSDWEDSRGPRHIGADALPQLTFGGVAQRIADREVRDEFREAGAELRDTRVTVDDDVERECLREQRRREPDERGVHFHRVRHRSAVKTTDVFPVPGPPETIVKSRSVATATAVN